MSTFTPSLLLIGWKEANEVVLIEVVVIREPSGMGGRVDTLVVPLVMDGSSAEA